MTSKKIKLKTSLNAINTKAAAGKRKALPKLKVILANPYKPNNAKLSVFEMSKLKHVIQDEIIKCDLKGREFVKEKKICLGLESSLRAISNRKTSCVLISQSIKPKFIINQIVYFTRQRSSTVPVYVVENLETFSETIFGIKALVIAFPLNLPGKLCEWVSKRTKGNKKFPVTKEIKEFSNTKPKAKNVKNIELKCIYLRKKPNVKRAFVPETVVEYGKPPKELEIKEGSGDYISFSKPDEARKKKEVSVIDFQKERDNVITALQSMTSSTDAGGECESEGNTKQKQEESKRSIPVRLPDIVYEEYDEDDEFLNSYIQLHVHKIQGNRHRKRKENEEETK